MTRMIAIISVSTTLCIEAKRKSSDVSISLNSKPAGNVFEISAITLLISALTAVTDDVENTFTEDSGGNGMEDVAFALDTD